ncbi:hypothetical protein ACWGI9_39465 [Streptomyces sp. NPDC054833]
MTELSAARDAAVIERDRLAGSAYGSDRDLSARQSLYQWQTPGYDLPGIVAEELSAVRGRVVDVGCGNGKFIQRLREDRPDLALLGLDIAPGILAGVPRPGRRSGRKPSAAGHGGRRRRFGAAHAVSRPRYAAGERAPLALRVRGRACRPQLGSLRRPLSGFAPDHQRACLGIRSGSDRCTCCRRAGNHLAGRGTAIRAGGSCAEALTELAANDRYVFTQATCVNSPKSYEVTGDPQDTSDSVRVDIDCAEGYTWLRVGRVGSIWRVTEFNAP